MRTAWRGARQEERLQQILYVLRALRG